MVMLAANPQVAQDLPKAIDAIITYADRAGEHTGVMPNSVMKHRLRANTGEIWHGAHVAKVNAFHGGPRTLFTQASRISLERYEVALGYTVSVLSLGRDFRNLINKEVLRQVGGQQNEAIMRDVDRKMLAGFSTWTNMNDRSGNPILANSILDQYFDLQAAEDDSDSPIQMVAPTAHIEDLIKERTTTSSNSAVITRPLSPDAASMLTNRSSVEIQGVRIKEARNSPKFGSDGYTGIFRMGGIHFVTGPVLEREMENHPRFGGGAQTTIIRKFWGFGTPPHSLRNWTATVKAQMPKGGK